MAAPENSHDAGVNFTSAIVDRIRAAGGVLDLPGGQILLPKVFGFCRGVQRALMRLDQAVREHAGRSGRLFLLGQIIHNPWVNEQFQQRGVRMLGRQELDELEKLVHPEDSRSSPPSACRCPWNGDCTKSAARSWTPPAPTCGGYGTGRSRRPKRAAAC